MSVEECSKLLGNLENLDRVQCSTDGERYFVWLNLDGLKSKKAFAILDEIRKKVPRQFGGKPVSVYTTGVFELEE